jgi:hypothetical protein
MSGFTLAYTANMFILMILYDFCLFLPIVLYNRIRKEVESPVQVVARFIPWKISSGEKNLVLQALQFLEVGVCR